MSPLTSLKNAQGALSALLLLQEHSQHSLYFTVPFKPQSKNHRVPIGNKRVKIPEHVKAAQRTFETLCVLNRPDSCPWRGPVFVELLSVLPISKANAKKQAKTQLIVFPTSTPDVDNLAKLPLDAMTKSEIWLDDAQVVGLLIVKMYGPDPRTVVRAWEISDVEAVQEDGLGSG